MWRCRLRHREVLSCLPHRRYAQPKWKWFPQGFAQLPAGSSRPPLRYHVRRITPKHKTKEAEQAGGGDGEKPRSYGRVPRAAASPFTFGQKIMKLHFIPIAMLIFTGCRRSAGPAHSRTENVSRGSQVQGVAAGHERSVENENDRKLAKGVVILKTGEKVAGQIFLQCPGYLIVCFKINSSEPGNSQLVSNKDVQTVFLEGSWEEVDPQWRVLQTEMQILTEQSNVRKHVKQ